MTTNDSTKKDTCLGAHCWHSDGIVLPSYPPQYPQTCCWCGERQVLSFHNEEVRTHGLHLRIPGTVQIT